ncbi:hypothetical protein Tcan_12754 [Toxocara canis]|uniref:Uncharacterized protein n=1 Tax=Toxocara canis TaxID=6265 RepID=A0A0B2VKI0_TOXCA|nr:hypothetical protein Tcan_12754 [Toxocara canis]
MGCAPSSRTDTEQNNADGEQFNEKEPPPVPVNIGCGVSKNHEHRHSVIFVFVYDYPYVSDKAKNYPGGPGSQKGVLIEELVKEFDFVSINVEDIVFNYLPNKVANTVENSVEIQELLKRDHTLLTVEWILSMMSAKLSTSMNERFVIDIIPALSSILRSDSFKECDQDKNLENFERRHPIMCALEINVVDEHAFLRSATKETNEKGKEKELSPELSAFIRGADEADKGRLEKRIDAYHKCSAPFLSYFKRSRRVVSMDINTTVDARHAVATLRDVLLALGFSSNNDSIRAILFAYSSLFYTQFSSMLRALRRYINSSARPSDSFLVLLDCISDGNDPPTKRTTFLETKTTYLDKYFKRKITESPIKRQRIALQAISSTRDEVCLFPQTISTKMCKKIGHIFGKELAWNDELPETNQNDTPTKRLPLRVSRRIMQPPYTNGSSLIKDYVNESNAT